MGRRKNTIDPEKEKHWRNLFGRFHKSGEPFRKFCANEGISPNTFQYWRRELRNRDEARGKVSAIKAGENRPSQMRENFENWARIFEDFQSYSGSVKSFCTKHGISPGNMHYWKTKLEKGIEIPETPVGDNGATPLPKGNFVEIHLASEKMGAPSSIVESETSKSGKYIELVVPGGCAIRITHDSDFALVNRLLSFMEER